MASSEKDHCRHVEQIDFASCIRCGSVNPPAFVFDDGTFYCYRCLCFMTASNTEHAEQVVRNFLKGGES